LCFMSVAKIQLRKSWGFRSLDHIQNTSSRPGFEGSASKTVCGWEFPSGLVGGSVCVGGGVCLCVCLCVWGVALKKTEAGGPNRKSKERKQNVNVLEGMHLHLFLFMRFPKQRTVKRGRVGWGV